MSKKLLVIVPDRLAALINKGEMVDRYYNPGNLFREVHILQVNPSPLVLSELQRTVGDADLIVHSLSLPSPIASLGWQLPLLHAWVEKAIKLAQSIAPDVIRSYGNFQSGYLATQVAARLAIPSVISLHTHPEDNRRQMSWLKQPLRRLGLQLLKKFEAPALRLADRVIIVYEPQWDYARRGGARDIRRIYNLVNPSNIAVKTDYHLHQPPRILCVSRQFERKNPVNIIRAIKNLNVELTLIGDGPIHDELVKVSRQLEIEDQVHFVTALDNNSLCQSLPSYDLFAVHWDTLGIPKSVIEPLLAGLPVVINQTRPQAVPEVDGDWVYAVEDTESGYRQAFEHLLANHDARSALGRGGREYAQERFAPQKVEQQLADLYLELL